MMLLCMSKTAYSNPPMVRHDRVPHPPAMRARGTIMARELKLVGSTVLFVSTRQKVTYRRGQRAMGEVSDSGDAHS